MNTDKEINAILSLGNTKIYMIDPSHKDQITRSTIDSLVRDARSHLNKKRKVYFVLVRE